MSNPNNYLSDAARKRDEKRRNLLAELAKLNKEDEDEKRIKERERSRIKELEEDQERAIRMKKNLQTRKREISIQMKQLKAEDAELDHDNNMLTERLRWLSRELTALKKGEKYEYPMYPPRKEKVDINKLKEAREKIKEKEEFDNIFEILNESKNEEPKNEEPKNEEPKNEEPKNEEPKNEESENEEPKNEEPKNEESENEEPENEATDKLSQIIKFLRESKDEEIKNRIEIETKKELHDLFDKGVNEGNDELREFAYLQIMRFDKRDAFPITENDYFDWEREKELAKKFGN